MLTMKRSGDSTHPCRSPTSTVNGRDLTLLKRTQTSEQEHSDLAASNVPPSTPYSSNILQTFSWGTRSYAFSRSTKHVKTSLAYSQDFSKFCWRVKCGLYCYGRDENRRKPHLSGLIQLFPGVFFQGTWKRKCWLFGNSQKALRAAQNALAGRVFETPDTERFWLRLQSAKITWVPVPSPDSVSTALGVEAL